MKGSEVSLGPTNRFPKLYVCLCVCCCIRTPAMDDFQHALVACQKKTIWMKPPWQTTLQPSRDLFHHAIILFLFCLRIRDVEEEWNQGLLHLLP
jgi:hypothetical protein